jgi:hypothetical protein
MHFCYDGLLFPDVSCDVVTHVDFDALTVALTAVQAIVDCDATNLSNTKISNIRFESGVEEGCYWAFHVQHGVRKLDRGRLCH